MPSSLQGRMADRVAAVQAGHRVRYFAAGPGRSNQMAIDTHQHSAPQTDQEGEGEVKGIPRKPNPSVCPVGTLQSWLAAAEQVRFATVGQSLRDPFADCRVKLV